MSEKENRDKYKAVPTSENTGTTFESIFKAFRKFEYKLNKLYLNRFTCQFFSFNSATKRKI